MVKPSPNFSVDPLAVHFRVMRIAEQVDQARMVDRVRILASVGSVDDFTTSVCLHGSEYVDQSLGFSFCDAVVGITSPTVEKHYNQPWSWANFLAIRKTVIGQANPSTSA